MRDPTASPPLPLSHRAEAPHEEVVPAPLGRRVAQRVGEDAQDVKGPAGVPRDARLEESGGGGRGR